MRRLVIVALSLAAFYMSPLCAKSVRDPSMDSRVECPINCPLGKKNPNVGKQQIDLSRVLATGCGLFVIQEDHILEINSIIFDRKTQQYFTPIDYRILSYEQMNQRYPQFAERVKKICLEIAGD